MFKKLVSGLLITTIITQIVGCYSYQEITKDEFLYAEYYEDLQIKTKNQLIYRFNEGDYIIREDTLLGNGKIVNNLTKKRDFVEFKGGIYFEDIESFYFDRFDTANTILSIGIVAGLLALIISNIKGPTLKGLGDNHGNEIL